MKKKWIVVTVVVAVALVVAGTAFARVARARALAEPFGGAIGMRAFVGLRGQLDLTDDQVIQLRHIRQKVRAENETSRGEVRANILEAAKTLLANPDDITDAQAILARNAAATRTMKANALAGIADALKVLTPDQRSMIASRIESLPAVR